MRKSIVVVALCSSLFGSVYERDCVSCHVQNELSLERIFYKYVLTFSTELSTKAALKDFLMNPLDKKSLLPPFELELYKIKEPSSLSEAQLEEAIDEYWEKYTFIGKIK